jgi:hypothetical protein
MPNVIPAMKPARDISGVLIEITAALSANEKESGKAFAGAINSFHRERLVRVSDTVVRCWH